MTARVIWWNPDRGHGFVRNDRGDDIFVHHAAFEQDRDLLIDQVIEFEPVPGTVGTVAANARVLA